MFVVNAGQVVATDAEPNLNKVEALRLMVPVELIWFPPSANVPAVSIKPVPITRLLFKVTVWFMQLRVKLFKAFVVPAVV